MTDIVKRAQEAFAAYRGGLGRELIDEMITEIERLRQVEADHKQLLERLRALLAE